MAKSRRKPIDPDAKGVDVVRAVMTLKKLAAAMGVSYATVKKWKQNGIPLTRLDEVHQITGVPMKVLRPDYKEPKA